jgi:tetratricopeptide (TPR) repeat protein/DNA-directed RNA polymerase subunit RPC12/RpoP
MPFTSFPCPSCKAILRLADSSSANALIRCPKCGTRFRVPAPAEDDTEYNITSAEPETAPLGPPRIPAARRAESTPLPENKRPPVERSRTALWVTLGVAAGVAVLLFLGVGVAGIVWLMRQAPQPQAIPKPAAWAPPPALPPPAGMAPLAGNPVAMLNEGNRCLAQGDLDGAIAAYSLSIESNPNIAAAYCNRGLARSRKGDYDGAIADETRAIELDPRDPFPFINRANARILKEENPEAAIADASQALKLRPGIPAALLNRGMARDQKGDLDGALVDFNEALTLLPTFWMAYEQRGQTWMEKEQWDKAEADFTRLLEHDPSDVRVHQKRGAVRRRRGNHQGAIEDFTVVLQHNPRSLQGYYSRGLARLESGDLTGAQADLDKVLVADPAQAAGRLLRGWLHLSAGRTKEAAQDAEAGLKAKGWKDKQTPYLAILAHLAHRRGQQPPNTTRVLDEAIRNGTKTWPQPILKYLRGDVAEADLLRAAADNDQRTEAHAYVGVVLWLTGATDKAREHFQWVRDKGNHGFIEYDLAVLLLRRLQPRAETRLHERQRFLDRFDAEDEQIAGMQIGQRRFDGG